MKQIINAINKYEFIGIVCEDGHEHTVKAFGNICGTPLFDYDDELDNQLAYCEKIALGQDIEILTANSVEEAVEKDIIDEFDDGEYFIK